jgi:hypothetical protein
MIRVPAQNINSEVRITLPLPRNHARNPEMNGEYATQAPRA